ncbi:MAG TPA: kelch repeat-containing protein [Planctomycetota bacterium]
MLLAFVLPACGDGGTAPALPPSAPPTGVAVGPLASAAAQVTWTDATDNEASFVLQTSPDDVVWSDAGTANANATSGVVYGLSPGVLTHIRVVAVNVKGSAASTSVTHTSAVPAWSPLAAGPAPLFYTASAFDPGRRRMYVFGGQDDFLTSYNTLHVLTLDGTPAWFTITPANAPPSARFASSLIYDPLRDRLILFGGQIGTAAIAELWEFRITTLQWFPLTASGIPPSPRHHHSAIYDAGRARMVVFGGENGSLYAQDSVALSLPDAGAIGWTTISVTGSAPKPRTRHSAVYDDTGRRMIIFGGIDGNTGDGSFLAQDTWSLDLQPSLVSTWTEITAAGPPGFREGHTAVWDSMNRQMVVFGGFDDSTIANAEVWTLSLENAGTWALLTPVSAAGDRAYGAAIFDPVLVRMTFFGGVYDDTLVPLTDTFALDL